MNTSCCAWIPNDDQTWWRLSRENFIGLAQYLSDEVQPDAGALAYGHQATVLNAAGLPDRRWREQNASGPNP